MNTEASDQAQIRAIRSVFSRLESHFVMDNLIGCI